MAKAGLLTPDLPSLRAGGQLLVETLEHLVEAASPGVTTLELDRLAEGHIRSHGGVPAFLGHRGFPATICASVGEQVVHGLPSDYRLVEGDALSIDLGVKMNGWYTDSAVTVGIGKLEPELARLLTATQGALTVALGEATAGRRTGDLGAAVQRFVESAGFGVIRDCVGHGIGQQLHLEPSVPNFGKAGTGTSFKAGMVIAIEPMVTLGSPEITVADDKWTVLTRDRSAAAHFEETVLITDGEPERLTPLDTVLAKVAGTLSGRLPGVNSGARLGRVA